MNDGSDPAASVLAEAEALMEDTELKGVSTWKKNNPGKLAVGYLPIYAPRPLFEALGCLPVAIFGGGDQLDIVRGDSYFQSYICHIPRSTVELGLGGQFDALDGMVFPSICDVIRNLGGMWKMLFPERYSAYLDLPQNFDPNVGGRFYASELRRIANDLTERGAERLTDEALTAAIDRENKRRALIDTLDQLRGERPWMVNASEAYAIVRAGAALMADEHSGLLSRFLEAVQKRERSAYDRVRVVLRGGFCEQPPVALIRALERAGCDVIDDDFQLGARMIDGDVDATNGSDPVEALALAFLKQGRATSSRYVDDDSKGEDLIKAVKISKADGVVFAAASFCDPALLDQPMLEAAVRRAGIPFTSFKYAENTGQFQTIREQAGAFSDAVKLWGNEA